MTDARSGQIQFRRQINFVADENPFLAGKLGEIIFVRAGQRFAGVEDVQNQFRLRQRFAAAADAFDFNFVAAPRASRPCQ